jgi:hypothetical protein
LVEKEAVAFLDERYPFLGLENEVYFYQIYYKCIAAVSTNNVLGLNVLYFEYDSDESKDTSDLLVRYEAVIAGIQSIMI